MTTYVSAAEWRELARRQWSEEDFLRELITEATSRGWMVFHPRPARAAQGWRTAGQGTPRGFPDLVLARAGISIFAELKSEGGRLTDPQREWLEALGGVVWRPSDWPAIIRILDGGEMPRTDVRIRDGGDASEFERGR